MIASWLGEQPLDWMLQPVQDTTIPRLEYILYYTHTYRYTVLELLQDTTILVFSCHNYTSASLTEFINPNRRPSYPARFQAGPCAGRARPSFSFFIFFSIFASSKNVRDFKKSSEQQKMSKIFKKCSKKKITHLKNIFCFTKWEFEKYS